MANAEVIKSLKSLLLSRKSGMFIHDLVKEYRETEGTNIPYQKLGYNSFLELLRASDSFNVTETERNNFFVSAKPSENSKHVTDLVKRQHFKKNSKNQSHRTPLESIDESQLMKKPIRYLNKPQNNHFSYNQHKTLANRDDNNNNNNQTGQAATSKNVYHDENKINISDRLKEHHQDDVEHRYKQDVEPYRRESKGRNGPHTASGYSNQITLIDRLRGPFDPRWTVNRRGPLTDHNSNTMNMVPVKMGVQFRLEIPKLIDMNKLPEDAGVMEDTVSQIIGWNFEIDHTFLSDSAMPQTYSNPMAALNGPVYNDLNLARLPFDIKHSGASGANHLHVPMPIAAEHDQLNENKAITEIPSLNLPWYDDEWPITVTTVASTDDVWGYLRGHDYFPKLESVLSRHEKEILSGKKVPSIAENIKPGGYYLIMIPKCYRLRVLHINDINRKALCWLIDYGEDEWFNWDQMYEMDHDLSRIPGQVIRFSLVNLEDFASHKKFTNKAIACLIGTRLVAQIKTSEKEFTMQKHVNRMDPKVKILLFNQITGQNVNEMILGKDDVADEPMNQIEQRIMVVKSAPKIQTGLVDVDIPIAMETEPIVERMEIPIRNLPAKKQVSVIITSVSSPSDFHFRLLRDDGMMSSFLKSLSNTSFNHRLDFHDIKTGNYYVAKFADGRWYRLQVKDLIGPMVDVYRCDVGDIQRIRVGKLCPLTSEFVQWPQLAIPAKLGGIIPVDGIWTEEATAYFRKLTLNVRLHAHFTESHESRDKNGVTYPIEVSLIEGQICAQIGDIMIEQHLAKMA